MPPRLNKRQQRELEELEALGGPQANSKEVEASTDDEQPPVRGVTAAGFSAVCNSLSFSVLRYLSSYFSFLQKKTIRTMTMMYQSRPQNPRKSAQFRSAKRSQILMSVAYSRRRRRRYLSEVPHNPVQLDQALRFCRHRQTRRKQPKEPSPRQRRQKRMNWIKL